jgi:hypothetical protein
VEATARAALRCSRRGRVPRCPCRDVVHCSFRSWNRSSSIFVPCCWSWLLALVVGLGCPGASRDWLRFGPESKEPLPDRKRLLDVGLSQSFLRRNHHRYGELRDATDLYLGHGDARLPEQADRLRGADHPVEYPVTLCHHVSSIRDAPGPFAPRDASRGEFIHASHDSAAARTHRRTAHRRRHTRAHRRRPGSVAHDLSEAGRQAGGASASAAAARRAFNSGLTTFPVGLRGRSSTKMNCRGTL